MTTRRGPRGPRGSKHVQYRHRGPVRRRGPRGPRGSKQRQRQGRRHAKASRPTRAAWIETTTAWRRAPTAASRPTRAAWIETCSRRYCAHAYRVAAHAGRVDRNTGSDDDRALHDRRGPRGPRGSKPEPRPQVFADIGSRPTRAAWIETRTARRTAPTSRSRPTRAAWIETWPRRRTHTGTGVAAHAGRVDRNAIVSVKRRMFARRGPRGPRGSKHHRRQLPAPLVGRGPRGPRGSKRAYNGSIIFCRTVAAHAGRVDRNLNE